MGDMGGLHGLTCGGWDLVLNWGADNLCDGVAVLNLNWDKLDLGVVNTVLGDYCATSVLDSGGDRVSNSMGNWGNWSNVVSSITSSITSKELGISFGISLSFTLDITMITSNKRSMDSRCVTKSVSHFLADLFILNLLGIDDLLGAHILSRRHTGLGQQNLNSGDTVGSGHYMPGMVSCSKELRVGLSFCVSSGGSSGHSQEARQSKELQEDSNILD